MSMTLTVKPTLVDRIVPNSFATDIALVVAGAALTAGAAQLQFSVPGNPVPFTFQTLAVLLTGAALGSVRGLLSMALYVVAGLALPVYSEGAQGLNVLLGATGGYLFGFIVAAAVVGRLAELNFSNHVVKMMITYVVGSALIYAVGVPVLAFTAAGGNFAQAAEWGLYPFLAWDAAKAVVAAALVPGAWALIKKVKGN